MDKIRQNPLVKALGFNRIVLCLVLLGMYGFFALFANNFVSYNRILSAMNYAYFLGFLAIGVTFVIATGGIDFSIGPVMFCAAIMSGYLLTHFHWPLWLCLIASIVVGMLYGTFHGYLVAYKSIPSFITSMAIMQMSKGIASVFTKAQSVSWPQLAQENGWYRNLIKIKAGSTYIPVGLIILLAAAIICSILLNKTKMGRYFLSLGSNREAVRLSGVDVRKWEMRAYMICGTMAGIAAIFFVAAYTTVQPGYGDQYNNEAIAGCVMGGTSMVGGLASVGGTFIGVMIISILQEGILAIGLNKNYQLVITGLIVIVAVFLDVLSRRRKN
ncbi:MAG TPA: ABC transporter permease [Clostridia bacterium]|nr:ABC transporter permease [Clostridia bacterium]